jgi:hypothetical protein
MDEISAATGHSILACSHSYHISCLTNWFSTQVDQDVTESCPTCRHVATEKEALPVTEEDDESVEPDIGDENDGNLQLQQQNPSRIKPIYVNRHALHAALVAAGGIGITDHLWAMLYDACGTGISDPNYVLMTHYYAMYLFDDNGAGDITTDVWTGFLNSQPTELTQKVFITRETLNSELIYAGGRGVTDEMWETSAYTDSVYSSTRQALSTLFVKNGAPPVTDEQWQYFLGPQFHSTWRRIDVGEWFRSGAAEGSATRWNVDDDGLPPQSLAFETAFAATKFQAVWRGYTARKVR